MTSNQHNRGFTLIETLVAVLLLATAIAGPLTIASRGLNSALVAKDQITAFYLAQDAVEQVRFLRDSNRLASQSWLAGLDGGNGCVSADGSSYCYLDSTAQAPAVATSCSGGVCPVMCYDSSNKRFAYSDTSCTGFTKTIYTRKISITTPACNGGSTCNSDEATLTVNVTWTDLAGVAHPGVTVHEELFNWQP